jgi:MFS family permease
MMLAMASLRGVSQSAGAAPGAPLRQLAEGFRYIRHHRRTRTLLLLFAITLLTTWTYQAIMPAYASERLGLGQTGYSLLMAAIGGGALVGALWVAGRAGTGKNRRGTVFGLVWGGAACVFLLGLVRHPALAVPLLVVTGFCQVGFFATANGLIQTSVPDELRSRVMGLWTFTFGATFPVGSLLMGFVSQAFGIPIAWCCGAVLMVLATGVLRWSLPARSVAEAEIAAERAVRLELEAEQAPGVGGPPA